MLAFWLIPGMSGMEVKQIVLLIENTRTPSSQGGAGW